MVTYLIGTDGMDASETIADHLASEIDAGDTLEVVTVTTSDDPNDIDEKRAAIEFFEDRFGDRASVTTKQFHRGRSPTDELVDRADHVDADKIVIALRRHTRTERIIYGSVSHSLLQKTTRPVILVPLAEYLPPDE